MHIVLGFLAVVGLAAAGIAFLAWRSTHSVIAFAFLAGGLALGARALLASWRRDSYAAAQFILFCSAIPVLICALWAFNVPESRAAWTVAAISIVPVIACAAYLYREHKRPEVLPNVLRQSARADSICELQDLQLTAHLVPAPSRDGVFELQIAVQSCVDAERVLTVALSGPPPSRLSYRARATVRVGPGEVGILALPIASMPGAGAPGTLHIAPDVSGEPGVRVRYWRARPYQRRIHPALQVLLLAGGHITWGGGWSVNVPAAESPEGSRGELPPDRWTISWKPDPMLLASARPRPR
jgi:hypothetical protein